MHDINPNQPLSKHQINWIVFLFLALYPLVGMGIDLIAPSLPAITRELNTSNFTVKNLITLYLLGYALGNFCTGFLSDAFGRRKLALAGLSLFVIASLIPIYFENISILLIVRLLQGFTLGAFAVIARAVLSDVLPTPRLIKTAPMLATMWGLGPVIGPVIGGYLQYYFNWQACFYFFAGFAFLGFMGLLFTLPETLPNPQVFNFKQIKNNFLTILTHPVFMGVISIMGTTYSLLIVFNTLGPFLIQTELGQTPIYFGHLAFFMGLAFLIGTIFCRRLISYFSPEQIFSTLIPLFLLLAVCNLLISYFAPLSMTVITISSLLMFFGCGIVYPAGMAKGLSLFKHLAGSGSAVMNLINVLITSLTAFFMGYIQPTSAVVINWVYVILLLACFCVYIGLIRPQLINGVKANQ